MLDFFVGVQVKACKKKFLKILFLSIIFPSQPGFVFFQSQTFSFQKQIYSYL